MEIFQVRVENLIGTKEKYEYDEASGQMVLSFVFRDGLLWPYNYGEILNTLGGDGDKLDAIIITSLPLEIKKIVNCRTVGILRLLDRGERDDKVICIPLDDKGKADIKELANLNKNFEKETENFLMELARQKNKVIKILSFEGRDLAEQTIAKSQV